MNEKEDFHKREEDREWRKKVDHEQVTLMTGVNVLQEQMREAKSRLRDFDTVLRGERGRGGLIAEYERQDDKLTKLYAVIFQDSTGQKGLLHDVDFLMGRKERSEKRAESRWAFATGVVAATVGAIATIIVALLSIEPVRHAMGNYLQIHLNPSGIQTPKTVLRRSGNRRKRHVKPPPKETLDERPSPDVPGVPGENDRGGQ